MSSDNEIPLPDLGLVTDPAPTQQQPKPEPQDFKSTLMIPPKPGDYTANGAGQLAYNPYDPSSSDFSNQPYVDTGLRSPGDFKAPDPLAPTFEEKMADPSYQFKMFGKIMLFTFLGFVALFVVAAIAVAAGYGY